MFGTGPRDDVWPVRLSHGRVGLRPITRRDAPAWFEVRARNAGWLRPWEATAPSGTAETPRSYRAMVRELRAQAGDGRCLPFVVTLDDVLVGQLTVSGITYGSARWAQIGYWVDGAVAGRGIIPTAVALAGDHCFGAVGLHRLEVNIRPENRASLRVVEKLGFRPEGLRPRFLHIDGAWRDHASFALLAEEVPEGMLSRLARVQHLAEQARRRSAAAPPAGADTPAGREESADTPA